MIFPNFFVTQYPYYCPYVLQNPMINSFQNYTNIFFEAIQPKNEINIVYHKQNEGILFASSQTQGFIQNKSREAVQNLQDDQPLQKSLIKKNMKLNNRNVLPNNVSLVLCYIRRINKSGKLVRNIISKLTSNQYYNAKRFYSYQLFLKENCTDFKWKHGIQAIINYSNPKCTIFSLQEQAFYNKVCRILIQKYLEKMCTLEVLNHHKINKNHVKDHLKVIRYIRQSLRGVKSSQVIIEYQ